MAPLKTGDVTADAILAGIERIANVGELAGRVSVLEAEAKLRSDENCRDHKEIKGKLDEVWSTLDEVKKDLGNRLPLWATIALPVFVGVAVYMITR